MPLNAGSTAHFENTHLSPAAPPRILIADPDDVTRGVYREELAHAGYEVIEAADGRDALAKVFGCSPALVITELTLPFVDGNALCDILRRDQLTAAVPILVVAAEAPKGQIERLVQFGVDGVLVKPTTPDSVLREARRLLSTPREFRGRPGPTRAHANGHHQPPADLAPTKQQRRTVRTKAHQRFTTTSPPKSPPTLSCPLCDRVLKYEQSHVGGVSDRHAEQWDYFVCASGCGVFQYRQRTRRVRRVE